MRGKWPYSCCFLRVLLLIFIQNSTYILVQLPIIFDFKRFVRIHLVQPYSSTDTITAWKNVSFILSERSSFQMIDNQSIAIPAVPICILTSFSVDEILLPRYVNMSTNLDEISLVRMLFSFFSYCYWFLGNSTSGFGCYVLGYYHYMGCNKVLIFVIRNRSFTRSLKSFKLQFAYIKRGARGVMVIVVGNGHGDTSSSPGRDWLHFT